MLFRKSTLLAVAASAVLGLAILAPSVADARGHGGGGGGHGMHGGGGMRMHGGGGMRVHGGGFRRIHVGHHRHHWHRHYVRWHRPIVYGYTAYSAVRPAIAGPCTCLTKEYTPEGAVLFKDLCTNESAINPPPQVTGALEQDQPTQAQYVPQYPPQAAVK